MAWIPIVGINNRNHRRKTKNNMKGNIIGLIIFIIIGLSFFFEFKSESSLYFHTFPLVFISVIGIFMIFIVTLAIIATKMSSPKKSYKTVQNNSKVTPCQTLYDNFQYNPYKIQRVTQNDSSILFNQENKINKTSFKENELSFCKYCGSKIDRNEVFCHECGSKV